MSYVRGILESGVGLFSVSVESLSIEDCRAIKTLLQGDVSHLKQELNKHRNSPQFARINSAYRDAQRKISIVDARIAVLKSHNIWRILVMTNGHGETYNILTRKRIGETLREHQDEGAQLMNVININAEDAEYLKEVTEFVYE